LARALAAGDLDGAREVARLGWALEGGEEAALHRLAAVLAEAPARDAPPAHLSGPTRGPATATPPAPPPARSTGPAASSTTKSPRRSAPATRWSSRAPSLRRSGWAPPRPRPRARGR